MKHTPGPWKAYEIAGMPTEILARWRVGDNRFAIAGMALSGDSRIDEANARLIASAPDLLEALRVIVNSLEFGELTQDDPLVERARAAIAKATGEQP